MQTRDVEQSWTMEESMVVEDGRYGSECGCLGHRGGRMCEMAAGAAVACNMIYLRYGDNGREHQQRGTLHGSLQEGEKERAGIGTWLPEPPRAVVGGQWVGPGGAVNGWDAGSWLSSRANAA